ncbi:protein RNA-directed DNA methylation 3-like isoform X2 [Magnolia sinica]|uniref:protein RNA-directed DNA methylation 3-like isoform X2 n=1 Tax=Magnolia sinica TaxID=86752 RepID=UPI002659BE66|nr:protein RNA-directed DNA methylation 3-like isoform X2 [Magnolia sinica]
MTKKGKEISGKASSGKRKAVCKGDNAARCWKKRRPHVLKFFDDEAVVAGIDGDEEDDGVGGEDDHFINDGGLEIKDKEKSGKVHSPPTLVKEEDLSDGELENILKHRYSHDLAHVTYADEGQETKEGHDSASFMCSMKEPTVWKVKCAVGHEMQVAFCLIQKYVDMRSIGTKLQIISAFSVEHVKGYIYIEADRERDVVEVCKGLCSIYSSRVVLVPKNEVLYLLSLQIKSSEVSKGTWVCVKYGKYKGDLAQVVAVDDARKRATVKLIPRIDLQAMAQKYSGGAAVKQASVPAPRLISSHDLEVFRPHIQCRRDPENGETFEILDGLMLKDGYLYKKVSIGSLCCWDIQPSPNEIQNFKIARKDASEDLAWLSVLYGDSMEGVDMTGEASESNLESKSGNSFELHDLVLLGQKDFGVIIGVENDSFQIIKGNSERADIATVRLQDIKNLCFDKKFKVSDLHKNIISIDDSVRVLEGPYKGRQGIVRHIYKGMVFIYDGNESENCGFFCSKSEYCEKYSKDGDVESKDDGLGPPGFGDSVALPTVPQSPRRLFNGRTCTFNSNFQGDTDRAFSVGQTLRIRVGPLKGYLCRVVAIYRSDVTVKLDSQLKVIRVNCEHLCEAGVKGYANAIRDSLHDLSASGLPVKSPTADPFGTVDSFADHEAGKDEAFDPWGSKTTKSEDQTALQNKATARDKVFGAMATDNWRNIKLPTVDEAGGWKNTGDWGKEKPESGNQENHSNNRTGWLDKSRVVNNDQVGGWKKSESSSWDKEKHVSGYQKDNWKSENGNFWGKEANNHDKGKGVSDKQNYWNHAQVADQDQPRSWDKGKGVMCEEEDSWGKAFEWKCNENIGSGHPHDPLGKATGSWKGAEGLGGSRGDSWKNTTAATRNEIGGWAPPDIGHGEEAGSWNKAKGEGGSQFQNWGKPNDINEGEPSGWNKTGFSSQVQMGCWNKGKDANKDMGGMRNQTDGWSSPKDFDGGWDSGCNKGRIGNFESGNRYQEDSWNKPKSFDGGRGSGGRRGRGGYKGGSGGRDHHGRGSGQEQGQPFGWNKDQDDHWNGDGALPGNASSRWNGDQVEGCDGGKGFSGNQTSWKNGGSWNTPKTFGGNQSTGWHQASTANEKSGGSGEQAGGWNKRKATGGDQMPCWKSGAKGGSRDGEQTDHWNSGNSFGGHKSSSWSIGTNSEGGAGNRPNSFGGDHSSGWNKGMHADKGGGSSDQNANWNRPKSFGRGQSSGWNKEAGNDKLKSTSFLSRQSSGCNKGVDATKETDGSGNPADSWNKPGSFGPGHSSWNKGSGADKDADGSGNPADSWNRPRSYGRGHPSGGFARASGLSWNNTFVATKGTSGSGSQVDGWNRGGKSGDGDQASGWNRTSTGGHQVDGWDRAAGGSLGQGNSGGRGKGGW